MTVATLDQQPFAYRGLLTHDARWPHKMMYTSYNGFYVPTNVFAKNSLASKSFKQLYKPTLRPVVYVAPRPPLAPRHPHTQPKSASSKPVDALPAVVERARPVLPPFHTFVTQDERPGIPRCPKPSSEDRFISLPPIVSVPDSQKVRSGPRWIEEPDMRISWCVLPMEKMPESRWPTQRTPGLEERHGSTGMGVCSADSGELRLTSPIAISTLLGLDSPIDSPPAHEKSPTPSIQDISPQASSPITRQTQSSVSSPRRSPDGDDLNEISSDEEPLRLAARTKLPGIASLNLPTLTLNRNSDVSLPSMRPINGTRAVARSKGLVAQTPALRASEPQIIDSTPNTMRKERRGSRSSSDDSSSYSPLSTSHEDNDQLDDDEDDYVPRSGSKRKASRLPEGRPKKRGPGARKDKVYKCPDCNKVFDYGTHLNEHAKVHAQGTSGKPFRCNRCNQGFGRIWDLQRHDLTHTGEKPHLCGYCDRGYNRRDALLRHMRQGKPGHPKPKPKKR